MNELWLKLLSGVMAESKWWVFDREIVEENARCSPEI
jgi:hypothetical protein